MKISSQISCVGFLLAVSTLTTSVAHSHTPLPNTELTIENRLSRLTEEMEQRGVNFPFEGDEGLITRGWGNGSRGSWGNGYRGGFANRHGGGSFVNRSPWRNGGGFYNRYRGGGFVNSPWRNGGSFINRW
ncbi:MAG: GrrA/OscA1 family cyclophane-containing rSAM-modified RiPP [Microcystaceae cyanobacterium]